MAEATIDPALAGISPGISPILADLGMILARSAERFGPKPALVAGGRTLTYQALHEMCDRVAGGPTGTSTGKVMRRELKTLDGRALSGRTHIQAERNGGVSSGAPAVRTAVCQNRG